MGEHEDRAAVRIGDTEIPFTDDRSFFEGLDINADTIADHVLDNIDDPSMPVRFYMGETEEHIDVDLDFTTFRGLINHLSDRIGEWAGIPVPVDHTRIRVEDRYPWKGIENLGNDTETQVICSDTDINESISIRNRWYCRSKESTVVVFTKDGKVNFYLEPKLRYVAKLDYWLNTMGCATAWEPAAEIEAQHKLSTLIPDHLMNMYFMTGTFLETSPRSRVTYLFRRLRPTIAMVPAKRLDNPDEDRMKAIAVLCMHPIAYYERTWAGAMVPTDDVIAHLLMMRGDERKYWALCNQHDPESPEAGL